MRMLDKLENISVPGLTRLVLAGLLGLAVAAATAQAAEVRLKGDISITGDVVRLGDLFENAGEAADIAVFRAPAPGGHGTIRAQRLQEAAEKHGLAWQPEGYVDPVRVMRKSREITPEEIARAIEKQLIAANGGQGYAVSLNGLKEVLHIEADAEGPIRVESLMQMYGGRFRAELRVDGSRILDGSHPVEGVAYELINVVAARRGIARGDIISRKDVEIVPVRKDRAGLTPALRLDEVVGMAARSTIAAGRPLSLSDLEAPTLVERGKAVLLVFERPGLSLSLRGKAMQDGAEGELIKVMNTQSNRILEGIVAADGRVLVDPRMNVAAADQLQEKR